MTTYNLLYETAPTARNIQRNTHAHSTSSIPPLSTGHPQPTHVGRSTLLSRPRTPQHHALSRCTATGHLQVQVLCLPSLAHDPQGDPSERQSHHDVRLGCPQTVAEQCDTHRTNRLHPAPRTPGTRPPARYF